MTASNPQMSLLFLTGDFLTLEGNPATEQNIAIQQSPTLSHFREKWVRKLKKRTSTLDESAIFDRSWIIKVIQQKILLKIEKITNYVTFLPAHSL